MMYRFGTKRFYIDLFVDLHGAKIVGGKAGGFSVLPSPLFSAKIKNGVGKYAAVDSSDGWNAVTLTERPRKTEIVFSGLEYAPELCVVLSVKKERGGLVWKEKVSNGSAEWSVMSITYPTPTLERSDFDMFIPKFGGRAIKSAGKNPFSIEKTYPGAITMQYFAVYAEGTGVYIGVEDGRAATKNFCAESGGGAFSLDAEFYAVGGGLAKNSFDVYGAARWQAFDGDWYDAAMIYADFVRKRAKWLPERGRSDTAEKFRKIPFWVSDYIPNSAYQGENKPMLLSAGSDVYEPGYWYHAPIKLQETLGVPIAYHVYNWHEIPFNIEYPHFLPAKEVFTENAQKLREHDIYVMPYINAVSWESRDKEAGHEVNFESVGYHGAVILENGERLTENYPQKTRSGHSSVLVQMCPEFDVWHDIMDKLTYEMEETLPIDGIYFDQIAATPARPCHNPKHRHLPGGGAFWNEGFNRMMKRIGAKKPKDFFYFTESCAEPYMKSFDGYLTWNWVYPDDVPAFAAIYAGYIQMIGRVTDGKKKDDLGFFKYCNAKSLVYGQQLGWCKADIIWREDRLDFIKNAVRVRYELSDLFGYARMLRPPVAFTPLPKLETEAGLTDNGIIESEQVIAGAWRDETKRETVMIAVNIADGKTPFTLEFDDAEYEITGKSLPDGFVFDGAKCIARGELEKNEIRVWKI